jgi:RNA polymerase sigma-70 factor (ECF subfamily)
LNQASPADQELPARRVISEQRALVQQALEDEERYNQLSRGVTLWVFRLTDVRTREEAHAQAEEILQEAVAQAFAKLETYDPARPAVNWLLGFAINVIRQARRRQRREAARTDDTPFDQQLELIDRLHGQQAQELLDLVSESDQQVLRLGVIEGLSGRELAVELGMSEGTARVRLYRAKQQLRRAYSQLP